MDFCNTHSSLKIYGLGASQVLAAEVAAHLESKLEPLQEEKFADGEVKIRPLNSIAGSDILVFQTMSNEPTKDPSQKITEMLIFLSLLKDYGAKSISVLLPYFSYSRSDQRKDFQDPLTLKYLAQLYESAGLQKILTLDVHNISAYENAFRCPCINLEATSIFCDYVQNSQPIDSLVIVSPDLGGIKRAEKFRRNLESVLGQPVSSVFLEKYRETDGLTGSKLVGSVQGSDALIYDDMISTGKTVLRAAQALRQAGARSVRVLATHGLFSENQDELLNSMLVDEFVVTDSNPILKSAEYMRYSKLKTVGSSKILAEGVRQFCI